MLNEKDIHGIREFLPVFFMNKSHNTTWILLAKQWDVILDHNTMVIVPLVFRDGHEISEQSVSHIPLEILILQKKDKQNSGGEGYTYLAISYVEEAISNG